MYVLWCRKVMVTDHCTVKFLNLTTGRTTDESYHLHKKKNSIELGLKGLRVGTDFRGDVYLHMDPRYGV